MEGELLGFTPFLEWEQAVAGFVFEGSGNRWCIHWWETQKGSRERQLNLLVLKDKSEIVVPREKHVFTERDTRLAAGFSCAVACVQTGKYSFTYHLLSLQQLFFVVVEIDLPSLGAVWNMFAECAFRVRKTGIWAWYAFSRGNFQTFCFQWGWSGRQTRPGCVFRQDADWCEGNVDNQELLFPEIWPDWSNCNGVLRKLISSQSAKLRGITSRLSRRHSHWPHFDWFQDTNWILKVPGSQVWLGEGGENVRKWETPHFLVSSFQNSFFPVGASHEILSNSAVVVFWVS